jgi:hypothetical protein
MARLPRNVNLEEATVYHLRAELIARLGEYPFEDPVDAGELDRLVRS